MQADDDTTIGKSGIRLGQLRRTARLYHKNPDAAAALGITAEIITVFARKKLFGYRTVLHTTIATGVLRDVVATGKSLVVGVGGDPQIVLDKTGPLHESRGPLMHWFHIGPRYQSISSGVSYAILFAVIDYFPIAAKLRFDITRSLGFGLQHRLFCVVGVAVWIVGTDGDQICVYLDHRVLFPIDVHIQTHVEVMLVDHAADIGGH